MNPGKILSDLENADRKLPGPQFNFTDCEKGLAKHKNSAGMCDRGGKGPSVQHGASLPGVAYVLKSVSSFTTAFAQPAGRRWCLRSCRKPSRPSVRCQIGRASCRE